MEPTSPAPAPTAMDVVAPPLPAAAKPTLATPPTPATAVPAITAQPTPASAKEKAPRAPGVEMAITATAIIIMVIAGLAVLAYIKR